MVIPYIENKIVEEENFFGKRPFIGYISPCGDLIDFSLLIGERGHDNWRNPITPLFIRFISFVLLNTRIEDYKEKINEIAYFKEIYIKNKYEGFDEFVLRGPTTFSHNDLFYEEFLKLLDSTVKSIKGRYPRDEWEALEYDLIDFFEKCYSKKDFFYSFGRVVKIHNENTVCEMYKHHLNGDDSLSKKRCYYEYRTMTLMSYFKDIMVQYLGYDSIERAMPEYDLMFMNNLYESSNGYVFSHNPKTILTSCPNPNERFYNWLINDWTIQRISRMYWNQFEKRFVPESITTTMHQTEKEIDLQKEIELIRREVPKEYRKEYLKK